MGNVGGLALDRPKIYRQVEVKINENPNQSRQG